MLLYLTSNQNLGLFDFLQEEKGLGIRPMNGEFDLLKFVRNDMRSFAHFGFLAIDRTCLKNTPEEILEALKAFEKFYDSRVLLLLEGAKKDDPLIPMLLEQKYYNLITATTVEGIHAEIRKCVSPEGMSYSDCKHFLEEDVPTGEYRSQCVFSQKDVRIAVFGSTAKSGVTTTAFHLAQHLEADGAKVSYTEANDSGHLKNLAAHYEFEEKGDFYERRGVEYYPDKQFPQDYHFNIFDFGTFTPALLPIVSEFEIRILCAPTKPYEIKACQDALKTLQNVQTHTLGGFTPSSERLALKSLLETPKNKVYFSEWAPSLFEGNALQTNHFMEILKGFYVQE